MEIGDVFVGTKLGEIQKKANDVKLVFEDAKTGRVYILTFEGLLFETSAPTLNRLVKNIHLTNTLGFRAISQLRHLNKNPGNYRQLFIEMEGSDDNYKLELLGAVRNYKISLRRQTSVTSNTVSPKNAAKKTAAKR